MTMRHKVFLEPGSLATFAKIIEPFAPRGVFLVAGPNAYIESGAEAILAPQLGAYQCRRFDQFSPNPQLADIKEGVRTFKESECDLIVAIGGGSAMDVAKAINFFAAQTGTPLDVVKNPAQARYRGVPLVAIPTTAGSGSEATQFAVMYIDKTKQSLSHPFLLPDVALVDPNLLKGLSARLTAACGMDALAQAVESYWGIRSDEASKAHAGAAIGLVLGHIENAVHAPTAESRLAMSKAAYLAGKAINTTRTSGPHAFSYNLTAHFQVLHGHAVALTLGEFLVFNCLAAADDTLDPRGCAYLQGTMQELISQLGATSPEDARRRLRRLMRSLNLETSLSELGIASARDRQLLKEGINPERLLNHPRRVTNAFIEELIDNIA
jgi:alcohol dehydrogenase class IV